MVSYIITYRKTHSLGLQTSYSEYPQHATIRLPEIRMYSEAGELDPWYKLKTTTESRWVGW
jgi:hypothetical protein